MVIIIIYSAHISQNEINPFSHSSLGFLGERVVYLTKDEGLKGR
jgi:hypothetical protein